MRRTWFQLSLFAGLIVISAFVVASQAPKAEVETLQTSSLRLEKKTAGQPDFDFYVLALSWSPSYCKIKGGDADAEQCGGKPLGFTVHGLWPQYERGFPQNCATGESGTVSRTVLREINAILPSDGLARHEWRKHGTCSGLAQEAYFRTLADAFSKIKVPDEFRNVGTARTVAPKRMEAEFMAANPGLPADGFAPVCTNGYLTEVRFCLTKTLDFRACAEVDKSACRARNVKLTPMN